MRSCIGLVSSDRSFPEVIALEVEADVKKILQALEDDYHGGVVRSRRTLVCRSVDGSCGVEFADSCVVGEVCRGTVLTR